MLATALAGLAALAAAMGIGRFAFTPLLPLMQESDGLSLAQGGWLASANYIGYFAGALLATRVRPGLLVSLVAIAASTLAMGVVHGMAAWLALRFAAGVASAWALVQISAWALPRLNARLAGVVFAGVGTGMALAGAACLALMQLGASASQAWLALGGVAAAIALALAFITTEDSGAPRSAAPAFVWSGDARRLVLCYGAFGFGYIIPATYVPAMARAVLPDPTLFGWAWPIFGLAAAASTVFAPRALGHRRLWAICALVMAAGVAAPLAVPGVPGILLSALLVGATFMVITMAGMQEARAVAGAAAGAAAAPLMAAMTAAFAAGQIAGPLLVSALAHLKGGVAVALAVASFTLVLSALGLVRQEKPCPT